jgi:pimeloyl-ACP methyl ester carboxylesterase
VRASRHRSALGLAGAARGMLAQADGRVIGSLDKITVPTLVLVGADDTNFLAAADYMARKISGAARVTITGAGHASNLHQPAAFNRAVEEFLAGLPATA